MTKADELAELMPSLRNMIVISRYGIQHPTCEDVIQDIFIACLQALPKFNGTSSLKTCAFNIAVYRSIDFVRREYRHTKALKRIPVQTTYPDTVFIECLADFVEDAIYFDKELLTPAQRAVAKQMFLGKNAREISQIQGKSVRATCYTIERVRKKVKGRLQ